MTNTSTTPNRRNALQTIGSLMAVSTLGGFTTSATAQAWPAKPIKIIVSFPPGGASDIVARVVGEQLAKVLNQAVVVDNRPGAGGSIGGAAVKDAPADGYTLLLANSTPLSIGPFALEKQPYDPVEAFTHVAMIGTAPCVVMANPSAGLRNLTDLEAAAKRAGTFNYGSGGPASIGHVYGELMRKTMGANFVHVPYRGGAPMTTDLIGGSIPVGIDVLTAYVPYFKSGQLVPLAVTSAKRSALVPDVPSVTEIFGYRNMVLDNFFGISAPAKLPADISARLNSAVTAVLQQPDIQKRMLDLGIQIQTGSSSQFDSYVRSQVALLAPTVRGAGVKL